MEDTVAKERILVVDDSSQIRATLRRMILEPEGYEVLTAADGQKGLECALREHPDLILLDVNMPRLSGIQVLEELERAGYEWPVILMTSHGSEEVAIQALRLGVRDYVHKPFQLQDVLARVRRALVESRLRRERAQLLQQLEATNATLSRRVSDLTVLQALGQAVTSLLDMENMLGRVVEGAVYLCRADEGVLYLADPDTHELYITAAKTGGQPAAQGQRLRVMDRLAERVFTTGKPILLTSKVLTAQVRTQTGYLVHSLLSVPLKTRGRSIGVLCVVNKARLQDFTRDDIGRLSAVASYAAIAIENSRLVATTRRDAVADALENTVATVAHYINNPLMSLMVKADGLVLAKERGALVETDVSAEPPLVEDMSRFTERKVQEIKAVLAILSDLASPQLMTNLDDVQMLDIEARVRDRLRQIRAQYKA
jgi:two-component system NtrC family sensor kinase